MHSMLQFHSGSVLPTKLVTTKEYAKFRAIRDKQCLRYPAYEAYWYLIEQKFYASDPATRDKILEKWHAETGYDSNKGF